VEEPPANPNLSETMYNFWESLHPDFSLDEEIPKSCTYWRESTRYSCWQWGKVMIQYESLPSPATIFVVVCKLDELINDIVVPQSTLNMLQTEKSFEVVNEEMKVYLRMNIYDDRPCYTKTSMIISQWTRLTRSKKCWNNTER